MTVGDKIIYFGKEYTILDYNEEERSFLIESDEYPMWITDDEINLSDYLHCE